MDAPSKIYQQLTRAQRAALDQRVKRLQALTERRLTDLRRGSMTPVNAERAFGAGCADTDAKTRSEPRH